MKRGKLAVDGMGGGRDGLRFGGVWTGGCPALPLFEHPLPTGSCLHASEPQGFLVGESLQSLHELPWLKTGQKTQGICLRVLGFLLWGGIAREKLCTLYERTAFFQQEQYWAAQL